MSTYACMCVSDMTVRLMIKVNAQINDQPKAINSHIVWLDMHPIDCIREIKCMSGWDTQPK